VLKTQICVTRPQCVKEFFYHFYNRICLSCEDDSSLPPQKSIVTCCSKYGRKWIIGLTFAVSQMADTFNTHEVCKYQLESFSFHL